MKLFLVLVLVAVASGRPDGAQYDSKYDNFNVDEIIDNERLLKAYTHCFMGDGKCTPEGTDIKSWIPEATQTACAKCSDKQKVLVAKTIKAIKEKLPKEYDDLIKIHDPENKYAETLKKFLEEHGN